MTKRYVPDDRFKTAPPLPSTRPPTRAESWAYVHHMYHDLKTQAEMKAMASFAWAGEYVHWVNIRGWEKQPDWTEGDPAIPAGVPARGSIQSGDHVYPIVKSYLDAARSAA